MKKTIFTIFIVAVLLSFSGCTSGESWMRDFDELNTIVQNEKPITIGVSLLNYQQTFFLDLKDGITETADQLGINVIYKSADRDINKQLSDIDQYIKMRVDAIIFSPVDSDGVKEITQKAIDQGILVLTVDIAVKGVEVDCHIASDNTQGGVLAGKYAVKLLREKGNVVIIDHYGITSVSDRVSGFESVLKEYADINIVAKKDAIGTYSNALKIMQELLKAKVDIDLVFAVNEDTCLGCLDATSSANDGSDIMIISYDGTDIQRKMIDENKLSACILQDAHEIGRRAIVNTVRLIGGLEVQELDLVDVRLLD